MRPHVFVYGNADEARDPAETEEFGVAIRQIELASGPEVHQHLRTPAKELPPDAKELARTASACGVAEVTVDEAAAFEDGSGGRGFGIDREVRQKPALGVWKGPGDQVKGR